MKKSSMFENSADVVEVDDLREIFGWNQSTTGVSPLG